LLHMMLQMTFVTSLYEKHRSLLQKSPIK